MDSHLTIALAGIVSRDLASQGISLRDAADRAGIPLTTLHRRLRGGPQYPLTFSDLEALAAVLGTSVTAMVTEAEHAA